MTTSSLTPTTRLPITTMTTSTSTTTMAITSTTLYNNKGKGSVDKSWPKRCTWRHLGPGEFSLFFLVLLETNDCKYRLYLWYRQKGEGWKTQNNENRPNDVRHVIWALGKSFLLFPSYYLILINILLHIQVVIYKIHETERDQTHLELQVNRYCLTPKSSTGKAGARDMIRLEHG